MNKSIKTLTLVAGLVLSGRALVAEELHADLQIAAIAGDVTKVKPLIAAKVDLEAKDMYGFTALQRAAQNGHLDVVEALVDAGADVNAKSFDKNALVFAAANGFLNVVQELHAKGATIDNSALIEAVRGQRSLAKPDGTAMQPVKVDTSEVVEYLLANGASATAKDQWGNTALSTAKAMGNAAVADILMKAGAR